MGKGMEEAIEEEIEVINSIYENAAEYTGSTHTVRLHVPETSTKVLLWLPDTYPEEAPRVRGVTGLNDDRIVVQKLQFIVDASFVPGEVYLFTFIDEIKDEVAELEQQEAEEKQHNSLSFQLSELNVKGSAFIEKWSSSGEIRDRGSVFIGRATRANSEAEMDQLVSDLMCDKKVSQANINMIAWRIKLGPDSDLYAQDFDDGGEAGAGACMLHVLKMANIENVVVVVSRYFSGAHIGPDRFKHIKNCARDALVEGGYLHTESQNK